MKRLAFLGAFSLFFAGVTFAAHPLGAWIAPLVPKNNTEQQGKHASGKKAEQPMNQQKRAMRPIP